MKRSRFVLRLPNDTEMLVTTKNGWVGLMDFVKYFNSEYEEDIFIRPVSLFGAIKCLFSKKVFNYDRKRT